MTYGGFLRGLRSANSSTGFCRSARTQYINILRVVKIQWWWVRLGGAPVVDTRTSGAWVPARDRITSAQQHHIQPALEHNRYSVRISDRLPLCNAVQPWHVLLLEVVVDSLEGFKVGRDRHQL